MEALSPKTLLLTNMVPPYRVPVFRELCRLLDGRFRIASLTMSEPNRHWKTGLPPDLPVTVLPGFQVWLGALDRTIHVSFGAARIVRREQPAVVILGGWDSIASWRALREAKRVGAKVVLWSGSHRYTSSNRGVRWALRRWLVGQCDAFIAYGSMAADYLVQLGADRSRVVVGANAVECSRFAPDPDLRSRIRGANGVSNAVVVLFSGQLIRRKGLEDLIEAMALVAPEAILWIVGEGAGRTQCEAVAAARIPGRHRFFGHVGYDDMPGMFNAADVFVMPSHEEVWGLVANEAMSAGLPAVLSSKAGASADLVEDGASGFAVSPGDPAALAAKVQALVSDPGLRHRLGTKGREKVLACDTRRYAEDFHRAVLLATGSS